MTTDTTSIQARLDRASARPWKPIFEDSENACGFETASGRVYGDDILPGDADFIANAPADIAYLLGEIDRLRGEVAK